MPPKASSLKKQKVKKGKKTKKSVPTLVTMNVSDSDEHGEQSLSLLDTGAVGRLTGSDEDGYGSDGGEASSQRPRPVPSATVTSGAGLSDEETEEEGAPPPQEDPCVQVNGHRDRGSPASRSGLQTWLDW